ncbi:hypothetical protein KJ865_13925, partial [Myxococcota bacterium]|nr:hypothetical protein [Myxococcota bacterium]
MKKPSQDLKPKKEMKPAKQNFMYRWLRHRGFILFYTAICGALLYGYSQWAFGFIRHESKSLSTDFWLRSIFYVGLLFFSLGISLTFDLFVNYSRFVNHFFGAKTREGDTSFNTSLLRGGQAQFYIIFLLAIGFSWWGFDRINDSFHAWYKTYGQYYTRLRSPREDDRIKAIAHLATIHNKQTAALLKSKIIGGTPGEKLTAIWMAGKSDFNSPIVIESLEEAMKTTVRPIKEATLLSLSRVVSNPKISTLREIEALLKESLNSGKAPHPTLLFSAAFLRSPEFLDLFFDLFTINDETTRVVLTYAIVWVKGATPQKERRIISQLSAGLDSKSRRVKCMATIGLTFKYESLD